MMSATPKHRFRLGLRLASSALLLYAALSTNLAAVAAGSPGASAEKVPDGQTAADTSAAHYQAGLARKEAATAKEADAAAVADPSLRSWLMLESREEFQAAATYFGRALKLDLKNYEAANELGFSLRKTGDYRKALGAYNFALVIKSDFYPAIEYRGEAYLALGMLGQAKDAYMTLFRNDLALAARLLGAMSAAVVEETEEAAPGSDFASWVAQRQAIAAVTPGAAVGQDGDW